MTYLEETGLREMASRTGGRYFPEKDREALKDFIAENLRFATAGEGPGEVKDHRSVAPWFLLGALPLWVWLARRHLS